MAIRLSTGCVQLLAQHKTLKEIFHDGAIHIYTGTQPANADTAISGTLLCTLAAEGTTFVAGTRSVPVIVKVTVTSDTQSTYTISIGTTDYTYTKGTGEGVNDIAKGLFNTIADNSPHFLCAWTGSDAVILTERFAASEGTPSVSVSTGMTKTDVQTSSRAGGIQFGSATGGVLSKESALWKGTVITDGTAGWFRIVGNSADGGGSSTTLPRIDGSIGTTSGDMILRTVSLLANDIITLTDMTITIPKA